MFKSFIFNLGKSAVRWKSHKFFSNIPNNNKNSNLSSGLLDQLSSQFQDASVVAVAIANHKIDCMNFDEWKKRILVLRSFGFTDHDCFTIINLYPSFLRIPMKELENVLLQWKLCDLEIHNLKAILVNAPQLFVADCEKIRKRVSYLRSICKTDTILSKLLINCPNIIFDNWNSILLKIQYLYKKKRISHKEIVSCNALLHSIEFIKLRFSLLEKCGIFKPLITYPHKVNKYEKKIHINPTLIDILDTPSKLFAIKTAAISVEEYKFYKELFMNSKVEDDTYMSDSNSDSDSDSDSDGNYYNAQHKRRRHSIK